MNLRIGFVGLLLVVVCATESRAGLESNSYHYFREPEVAGFELNPSGSLFLGHYTTVGITTIRVVDVKSKKSVDVFRYISTSKNPISLLEWVGESIFLIASDEGGNGEIHSIVRVHMDDAGPKLELNDIVWPGTLVDPLITDDTTLLWSPFHDRASAYRVPTLDLASPKGGRNPFRKRHRVTKMRADVEQWHCDANGTPLLATVETRNGQIQFWSRPEESTPWRLVRYVGKSPEEVVFPVGVLDDGRIAVLSRAHTGRLALYSYEPGLRSTIQPIAQHDTRDVYINGMSSQEVGPRSVFYVEKGFPKFQFFDPVVDQKWSELVGSFSEPAIVPVSTSVDQRTQILWLSDGRDLGRYVLVRGAAIVDELGAVSSRTKRTFPARIEVIEIEVPNVGTIEGYLTRPSTDEERAPLVVYPHGGPVGIFDLAFSNPEVLYLASRGFAVLQVNYRGSGGLGADFERLGWREWGRGIEDDIDAVFDKAILSGGIDTSRICIVGASYGGYSALMSVIRHPDRYRCAVSTAGVTDIGLMFTSSDFGETREGRKKFAELVGDPDRDYEEMKSFSPVYRVDEITTPILIVHGEKDRRVDVEHANRLAAMLRLHDKEFQLHIIPGLGHSGWTTNTYREHADRVANYLDWYLD